MGVDNRQRRAAKKKARQARRPPRPARERFVAEPTADDARGMLTEVLRALEADAGQAAHLAALLTRADGPLPPGLVREVLGQMLQELTVRAVQHGWRPSDLFEITTRRASPGHVAPLAGLLAAELRRHAPDRVTAGWSAEVEALGVPRVLDLRAAADLQVGLELALLLTVLPPIAVLAPPPGAAPVLGGGGVSGSDARVLAKVRALLAKAESSEFPEEAELLSAKAQELISRHALDRLLTEAAAGGETAAVGARRLWLAAPYVFQKGLLVDAVADANRCRSVISESLGFCTVVGGERDLAAVDLLVTSLLVQAETALRRFGRQTDRTGTSRTRSFRQSFLVAYASRIGERLTEATTQACEGTGRAGELVPVLRRQAEQVEAAREAMFPHLVSRQARVANSQGWAAGRAAADLASLETAAHLPAGA